MGADLLLTWMRTPHNKVGKDVPFERWRAIGHERIANCVLPDELVDSIFDDEDLWSLDEFNDLGLPDGADPTTEQKRDIVRGHLLACFDSLTAGSRRDVETVTLDGKSYWFTGGMSWGDDPSDAWGYINMLNYINLFETPILDTEL